MSTGDPFDLFARLGVASPFAPGSNVAAGRAAFRRLTRLVEEPPPPVAEVRELDVPGADAKVKARLYIPTDASETGPLILFLHGGGYAFCDLDTHDGVCRRIAARAGVRVLAPDYRLAPEHPFPAAYQDAEAVFDWLAGEGAEITGADTARLGVAGDSAGGGLAAALAQARREQIRHQYLIYPLLQVVETRKAKQKILEGHILSAGILDWIRDTYVPTPEERADPRVSPLLVNDLTGCPEAFIASAELDPLTDDTNVYKDKLLACGVQVTTDLARGLPHGFYNGTRILPGSEKAFDRAAAAVGEALRR